MEIELENIRNGLDRLGTVRQGSAVHCWARWGMEIKLENMGGLARYDTVRFVPARLGKDRFCMVLFGAV